MKNILIIIFSLYSVLAFSQAQIAPTGQVEPTGNHPVAISKDLKGTLKSVTRITERDSILSQRRELGMLVYVADSSKYYKLEGGIANGNWQEFVTNGGGTSTISRNSLGDSLVVGATKVKDNDNPENNPWFLAKNIRWTNAAVYNQQNNLDDAIMMIFSDSKGQLRPIVDAFFRELNKKFIFDGTGFMAVYGAGVMSMNVVNSVTPTTALWTAKTKSSGGRGIGMYSVVSTGSSTAFSFIINTNQEYNRFTNFDVWWYGQGSGGSFEVRVDGVLQATINTSSATGFQKTSVTGLTDANHSVSITPLGANCELLGFNGNRTGINGVRLHQVGQSGAQADQYLTNILADTATWNSQFRELKPSLVWLYLGSNERAGNMTLGTFKTNIKALISYIRSARDSLDIVLVGQSDFANNFGGVHVLSTKQYNDVLRQIAIEDSCTLFDIEKLSGSFAESNKKNPQWLFDGIHEGNGAGETIASAFSQGLPAFEKYDLLGNFINQFGTASFLPSGGQTPNRVMVSDASGNINTNINLQFTGTQLTQLGGNFSTAGNSVAGGYLQGGSSAPSAGTGLRVGGSSRINNFAITDASNVLGTGNYGIRANASNAEFQANNQGSVLYNWRWGNFAGINRDISQNGTTFMKFDQGINSIGTNNWTFQYLEIKPDINQTGSNTGIRWIGYVFRPVLTSINGLRIIAHQSMDGDVLLGVNSGKVGIGKDTITTLTAFLNIASSTTSTGSLNLPDGVAPISPINGDFWAESSIFKYRTSGVTKSLAYTNDIKSADEVSNTPFGNLAATTQQAVNNELQSDIDTRALDANTVHKTGTETVAGVKNFSNSPIVPTATNATDAINLAQVQSLTGKAVTLGITDTTEVPINSTRALRKLQIDFNDIGATLQGDSVINLITDGTYRISYTINSYGDAGLMKCQVYHTLSPQAGSITSVVQIFEESGLSLGNQYALRGSFIVKTSGGNPRLKIIVNNFPVSVEKLILSASKIDIEKLYSN